MLRKYASSNDKFKAVIMMEFVSKIYNKIDGICHVLL